MALRAAPPPPTRIRYTPQILHNEPSEGANGLKRHFEFKKRGRNMRWVLRISSIMAPAAINSYIVEGLIFFTHTSKRT